MQLKLDKLNVFDFDHTITKKHTFSESGLSALSVGEANYQHGIKHAQSNIKSNLPLKHNEDELSAVATYHNNPDFIAGYISVILQKKLTFKEKLVWPNEPNVSINVYQVEGISRPFLISYVPQYGKSFNSAISLLPGKNKHIELLRKVLFEDNQISSQSAKINFYDDSINNVELAQELSNVNSYLVNAHDVNNFSISKQFSKEVLLEKAPASNETDLLFYRFSDRLISKLTLKDEKNIKHYGFYKSSGANSLYEGTWFPFKGINDFGFCKPHNGTSYHMLTACYDDIFIQFLQSKKKTLFKAQQLPQRDGWVFVTDPAEMFITRFGNTECMLLSYLIGGGYWDSPDSLLVKLFIDKHYSYELKQLIDHTDRLIKFKNPQNIVALSRTEEDKNKVNLFLNDDLNQFNVDYYKTFLDYSIARPNQTDLKSKVKLIRYLCNEYQQHIIKNYQSYPKEDLLNQKKQSIELLCNILQQDPENPATLSQFQEAFHQHKATLVQRRDSLGMILVKTILNILTLGLASYCGLWKIKGQELQNHLDALIQPDVVSPKAFL